jgi:hypothetical protein
LVFSFLLGVETGVFSLATGRAGGRRRQRGLIDRGPPSVVGILVATALIQIGHVAPIRSPVLEVEHDGALSEARRNDVADAVPEFFSTPSQARPESFTNTTEVARRLVLT